MENVRKLFPILTRKVYGKNLVYFDNAATIQRPKSVIDEWNRISMVSNANIHRAVHCLASEATQAYEASRDKVREYLNARSREEIVFTSGTTASINLVAYSFGEQFVNEGDEIIVSEVEHHSNIVPWQLLCKRKKANLKVIPVDDFGILQLDVLSRLITDRTRLVAVTHVSNVLGIINPVKDIVDLCHSRNVPVLIDGAQGIVHAGRIDVQDIDCDFYVFSGHKIYAMPGTGVLYGKKKWLEEMPPFMGGGEMVGNVSFEETTFAPLPLKFEAGTQNFAGVATFKPALEIAELMMADDVIDNERAIRDYLMEKLLADSKISIYGLPFDRELKVPVFSMNVAGVHHEDLALILDKMGIAVRSGQMCAEPLMKRFGASGMLRVSVAPYNTIEEAEYFVNCLYRAIEMLRG